MHDWNPQSLSSLTISLSLFLSLPSFNSLLWKPWQSLLQPCMMQSTYTTCIIKGMFNGMAAVDFRPMLWGMKAVETHSVKKSLGASLSKQTTAEEVMECLDQKTLQTSILKLPLRRKMQVRSLWYLYIKVYGHSPSSELCNVYWIDEVHYALCVYTLFGPVLCIICLTARIDTGGSENKVHSRGLWSMLSPSCLQWPCAVW